MSNPNYPDAVVLLLYQAFSEDTKRASFYPADAASIRDFREWLKEEEKWWQERDKENYELVMLRLYREQEAAALGPRPAEAFPVGVHVKEELGARGWTPPDLAGKTGLLLANIQRMLDGAILGPGYAQVLHRALGASPVFWENLNTSYVRWLTVELGDDA